MEDAPSMLWKNDAMCQKFENIHNASYSEGYRFLMYRGKRYDVLVFKGTTSRTEIFRDMDARKVKCQLAPNCGEVHAGFNDVYGTMMPDVVRLLKNETGKPYVIVGHSLGAAVSTLAALHTKYSISRPLNAVFLLGSPRVGDETFVETFGSLVTSNGVTVKRFFMAEGGLNGTWDPITVIPKRGYLHVVPAVGIECHGEKGKDEKCTARQLHAIFRYIDVLKDMVKRRFWIWRKCGVF